METTRRKFIARFSGIAAASIVPAAIKLAEASPETLEERIERLEGELVAALSEKWPRGAEAVRAPYGNHAIFFMERDRPEGG
jgi:hypothetical protein